MTETNPSSPSAVELKACPFCGNGEITFYAVEDMLAADCRNCGAHGPIILDGKAITKPALAGEAWNTRAALQPQSSEELVERRKARRNQGTRRRKALERSMIRVVEKLLSEADYADQHYDEGVSADTAREAAKLLETLVERWQPIETAPKDGSIVLLSDKEDVGIGHWKTSYPPLHYWFVANGYPNDGLSAFEPTHWMPLPNPPA